MMCRCWLITRSRGETLWGILWGPLVENSTNWYESRLVANSCKALNLLPQYEVRPISVNHGRSAVNRRVAGSSPARGASLFKNLRTPDLSSDLHVALFRAHFMRVFLRRPRAPGCSHWQRVEKVRFAIPVDQPIDSMNRVRGCRDSLKNDGLQKSRICARGTRVVPTCHREIGNRSADSPEGPRR